MELKDLATLVVTQRRSPGRSPEEWQGPTATVRLELAERVVGYVDASASLDTVGTELEAAGRAGLGARGSRSEVGETGASASGIRGAASTVLAPRQGRGYFADLVRRWHVSGCRFHRRRRNRLLCWQVVSDRLASDRGNSDCIERPTCAQKRPLVWRSQTLVLPGAAAGRRRSPARPAFRVSRRLTGV